MKKLTILVLILSIFIIAVIPASAASVSDFKDVSSSSWYYKAVKFAVANELVNGTSATTFTPNGTLSRGQFITILGRMAGVDTSSIKNTGVFSDVKASAYFTPYIYWAYSNGFATAKASGTFGPDEGISREEIAAILTRYIKASGIKLTASSTIVAKFNDEASISAYAKEGVDYLRSYGILNGDNNKNVNPQGVLTRAECVQLFMNLINAANGTIATTTATSTIEDSEYLERFNAEFVRLLNIARKAENLSSVTYSSNLQSAATLRAAEAQTSFSHTRPNGSSFYSALTGYKSLTYAGECLYKYAYGTEGYYNSDPENAAKIAVNAYLASTAHKAILLKSGADLIVACGISLDTSISKPVCTFIIAAAAF